MSDNNSVEYYCWRCKAYVPHQPIEDHCLIDPWLEWLACSICQETQPKRPVPWPCPFCGVLPVQRSLGNRWSTFEFPCACNREERREVFAKQEIKWKKAWFRCAAGMRETHERDQILALVVDIRDTAIKQISND